jgi:nucleoside-diphosphate-sugar epimerase
MKILVSGSSGHLGEGLMRSLQPLGHSAIGIDVAAGPFTTYCGSITDRDFVRRCMAGTDVVLHAATLHKPHVATHGKQDFIDINITGTLNLLEASVEAGVKAFVFTSTTSVFGDALVPPPGAPAAWITEDVRPIPKNIYGVTKSAAEDLCQLFHRNHGLPVAVLRTSRFFPEADDDKAARDAFADANLKANEYLYRRVDLADVVSAHLLAMERAPSLGFRRYIISAPPPFAPEDLAALRDDAPAVVRRHIPQFEAVYARRGWRMAPGIDRVYVSARACEELCWKPHRDFHRIVTLLAADEDIRSPLARLVGSKGYHGESFAEGPYPVG